MWAPTSYKWIPATEGSNNSIYRAYNPMSPVPFIGPPFHPTSSGLKAYVSRHPGGDELASILDGVPYRTGMSCLY